MRTNWRLNDALKDRLIFKGMIQTETLNHMNKLPLEDAVDDFHSWAQLALADQQVWELANEPKPKLNAEGIIDNSLLFNLDTSVPGYNSSIVRLMSAIPQLVASHHPILEGIDPVRLLTSLPHFDSLKTNPNVTHAFDFCLSVLVMDRITISRVVKDYVSAEMREILRLLTKYDILPMIPYSHPISSTIFMCNLILSIFAQPESHPLKINPPKSTSIPYTSFMNLPLLFSATAQLDFRTCHISSMATPSFVLDGKWASFYSLSTTFSSNARHNFQPPVTDVQFSLATAEEVPGLDDLNLPSGSTVLSATGDDSFGIFTANGVLRADGSLRMIETNYRGQLWSWNLTFCPFGLFGTWGNVDDGSVNGYLWMFKEEWASKVDGASSS